MFYLNRISIVTDVSHTRRVFLSPDSNLSDKVQFATLLVRKQVSKNCYHAK